MERYPDDKVKNQEAAFVFWFYPTFLGKRPDSTHYATGTKVLSGIFKKNKKFPGARTYSLVEAADLFYYLHDNDVEISLYLIKFPDLLSSFVEKDFNRVNDIIKWLGEQNEKGEKVWVSPSGW